MNMTKLNFVIKTQMLVVDILKIMWFYGIYKTHLKQNDIEQLGIKRRENYTYHKTQHSIQEK